MYDVYFGGGQYCRDKGPGAHASARWSPSHPLGIAASPGLARDHTSASHLPLCLGLAASDHSGVCSAVQSEGINPYAAATTAPAGHRCLAGFGRGSHQCYTPSFMPGLRSLGSLRGVQHSAGNSGGAQVHTSLPDDHPYTCWASLPRRVWQGGYNRLHRHSPQVPVALSPSINCVRCFLQAKRKFANWFQNR